jgi:hypothetical protein
MKGDEGNTHAFNRFVGILKGAPMQTNIHCNIFNGFTEGDDSRLSKVQSDKWSDRTSTKRHLVCFTFQDQMRNNSSKQVPRYVPPVP